MRKIFTLLVLFIIAKQYVTAQTVTERTINFMELAAYEAAHPELFKECKTCPKKEADFWEGKATPNQPIPPGAIIKIQEKNNNPLANQPILTAPSRSPLQNWLGHVDAATTIPPDTHGAVGLNHVITATNNFIKIHNKVGGSQVSQVSISTFTGQASTCDPYMIYDPSANRWIFSAIQCSGSANNRVILMVSNTSDPTGTWRTISFIPASTNGAVAIDHPYVGFDNTKIVMSGREFNSTLTGFFGPCLFLFDKAAVYAGTAITFGANAQLIEKSFATDGDCPLPVTVYDPPFSTVGNPSPGTFYILQDWNGSASAIRLSTVTGNIPTAVWNTASAVFPTGGTPWNDGSVGNVAEQMVETRKLEANDSRISCGVMMNGKIWCSQHVPLPATGATDRVAVQWWQLEGTPGATFGNVLQRGRIGGTNPNEYKWFSSIAVNKNEDVLIGYTASTNTTRVNAAYSTRQAGTAVNTTDAELIYKTGLERYYKDFGGSRARWGDYSHSALDPVDNSLWTIQEYAEAGAGAVPPDNNSRWSTWWAQVPVSIITPPSVTINQAATQADPTAASPINFTVVFSSPVTGFTNSGVVLSGTAGATTATVTGSGDTYNVAVSGMTSGGTVIATIPAGVADAGGGVLNLASTSTDNTVTYLNTPPTVTINQAAAQADPTGASPINFTVVFNEPVTGFATGDVTISGTAGATTGTVTGSGATYNVAVTGMTGPGTVIADIPASVAIDIDGNNNAASTSTDNTVNFLNCVLTCPANIVVSNTPGQCGAIVNFTPTANAGCGTVTSVPASGSFFPIGTTTVNVSTTSGASCSFTVRVNDTQAPVITCPANIVVSNTTGQCGAVVTFPFPTVTDNCPFGTSTPRSITQSSSNTITAGSVSCNNAGLHTDNSYWRAYDLAPLALPGAFTINNVTFGIETANAAGVGTTQPITVRLYTSAGAFPGGTRTLVGSQTYNVPDQTNSLFTANLTTPVTVPANAILVLEVFTPDGQTAGHSFFIGSNTAAQTGPSYISAAACGAVTPTDIAALGFPNMHIVLNAAGTVPLPGSGIVSVPASGSVFPVGTTTVTSTATDAAGNTASCTFTVRVNDTQAPAITCPGNITVTTPVGLCTAVVPYTVTATDNCPGVTTALFSGLASNATYPIGVTTNTWRATDAAGNVSNCTFTVTVLDGQLPVISVQPANRAACVGTAATFSVTATNVTAYQWQLWNGTAWNNIAGATSASYTTAATTTAMNDGSYRVVLTGLCSSVTSGFATLTVNPLPIVSLAPSASPVLLPTQTISLVPTVSPTGGTFAWFKNGAAYTGATSNLKVEDVGTYRFVYTDANGCVSTSNDVVVSAQASGNFYVYPNPSFGQFSVRFFNNPNESVTVSVFNSAGQKVASKTVVTAAYAYTKIDVDLGARISSGIYLVEVHGSDGKLKGAKRLIVGHK